MDARTTAALDEIVARLRCAGWKEREAIKDELLALAEAEPNRTGFREALEQARKELSLELRWEIDEVLDAIKPPPPAPPPQQEKPKDEAPEKKQLTAADLNLVYDDPRGIMLYKTKKAPDRWFLTQIDPRSGQPQTYELHSQEVAQLKMQLAGSPYWVIGSGEVPNR